MDQGDLIFLAMILGVCGNKPGTIRINLQIIVHQQAIHLSQPL